MIKITRGVIIINSIIALAWIGFVLFWRYAPDFLMYAYFPWLVEE